MMTPQEYSLMLTEVFFRRHKDGKFWVDYSEFRHRYHRNVNALKDECFTDDLALAYVSTNPPGTRDDYDGYEGIWVAVKSVKADISMSPSFTLDEIEQAQRLVNGE